MPDCSPNCCTNDQGNYVHPRPIPHARILDQPWNKCANGIGMNKVAEHFTAAKTGANATEMHAFKKTSHIRLDQKVGDGWVFAQEMPLTGSEMHVDSC